MKIVVQCAALAACFAALLPAAAQAQYGYGAPAGGSIRCESSDGYSRTCQTPWQGRSVVVRQRSDTACIEGRNWRSRNGEITVDDGCRADFGPARYGGGDDDRYGGGYGNGYGGGNGSIRCDSSDGRQRSCNTPWRGRSVLLRQRSDTACIEGRNWTSRDGVVIVDDGCRGEFGPGRGGGRPSYGGGGYQGGYGNGYGNGGYGGGSIRCESSDGRPRTCTTTWRGPTRISRQLSDTACIAGRTWDARDGQVTVSGGCRAEFAPR